MSKRSLYRIIWIPSAVILLAMLVTFDRAPLAAVAVPGPFVTYTTSDRSITIQHPSNWKPAETSAAAVMTRVEFRPNSTTDFVVTSDLSGSLVADIAKMGNSLPANLPGMEGQPLPQQKPPIDILHEAQGAAMRKKYDDFKDGETKPTTIGGMEARVTHFTYQTGDIFSKRQIAGERVTLLSGDRRIRIVCRCLKDLRLVIVPLFDFMISSVQTNQTGG